MAQTDCLITATMAREMDLCQLLLRKSFAVVFEKGFHKSRPKNNDQEYWLGIGNVSVDDEGPWIGATRQRNPCLRQLEKGSHLSRDRSKPPTAAATRI